MAGSTLYPGALDNFAEESPTNLGDNDSTSRTHSERHDDMEAAMEAVQGELGTDPSGVFATVAERLDALSPGDIDQLTLSSPGTAVVPLTVIGTASQAADLMQFKDSGGTAIANVSAAGAATFAGVESTAFTISGTSILESTALLGTPTAPTAAVDTNTTQLATTAFVLAQAGTATPSASGTAVVGTSTLFARQDHDHGSSGGAPLDSPTFTGTPAAPTAAADTNTTQLATTAFVIGQAGTATPLVEGTAAAGTAVRFAREDHIHPADGGGGGGTGGSLTDVFMLMGA